MLSQVKFSQYKHIINRPKEGVVPFYMMEVFFEAFSEGFHIKMNILMCRPTDMLILIEKARVLNVIFTSKHCSSIIIYQQLSNTEKTFLCR